jgi:hypothetical protein
VAVAVELATTVVVVEALMQTLMALVLEAVVAVLHLLTQHTLQM